MLVFAQRLTAAIRERIQALFALITMIVGAAVGGNLILLALDISRDRQVRDRFVETNAKDAGGAPLNRLTSQS